MSDKCSKTFDPPFFAVHSCFLVYYNFDPDWSIVRIDPGFLC
jgi:hypothetical protein